MVKGEVKAGSLAALAPYAANVETRVPRPPRARHVRIADGKCSGRLPNRSGIEIIWTEPAR